MNHGGRNYKGLFGDLEELMDKNRGTFLERVGDRRTAAPLFLDECARYLEKMNVAWGQISVEILRNGHTELEKVLQKTFEMRDEFDRSLLKTFRATIGSDQQSGSGIQDARERVLPSGDLTVSAKSRQSVRENTNKRLHIYQFNEQNRTAHLIDMSRDQLRLESEAEHIVQSIGVGKMTTEEVSRIREPFLVIEICRKLLADVSRTIDESNGDYQRLYKLLTIQWPQREVSGLDALDSFQHKLNELQAVNSNMARQLKKDELPPDLWMPEDKVIETLDSKTRDFLKTAALCLFEILKINRQHNSDKGLQTDEVPRSNFQDAYYSDFGVTIQGLKSDQTDDLIRRSPVELVSKITELEDVIGSLWKENADLRSKSLQNALAASKTKRDQRNSNDSTDEPPFGRSDSRLSGRSWRSKAESFQQTVDENNSDKSRKPPPLEKRMSEAPPPEGPEASKVMNDVAKLHSVMLESMGIFYGLKSKLELDLEVGCTDSAEIMGYISHLEKFLNEFDSPMLEKAVKELIPEIENKVSTRVSFQEEIKKRLRVIPTESWKYSQQPSRPFGKDRPGRRVTEYGEAVVYRPDGRTSALTKKGSVIYRTGPVPRQKALGLSTKVSFADQPGKDQPQAAQPGPPKSIYKTHSYALKSQEPFARQSTSPGYASRQGTEKSFEKIPEAQEQAQEYPGPLGVLEKLKMKHLRRTVLHKINQLFEEIDDQVDTVLGNKGTPLSSKSDLSFRTDLRIADVYRYPPANGNELVARRISRAGMGTESRRHKHTQTIGPSGGEGRSLSISPTVAIIQQTFSGRLRTHSSSQNYLPAQAHPRSYLIDPRKDPHSAHVRWAELDENFGDLGGFPPKIMGKARIRRDEKVKRLDIWSQSMNQTALLNSTKADAAHPGGHCPKPSSKKGVKLLPYSIPVEMLHRRLSLASLKVSQLTKHTDSPILFKG